MRIVHVLLTSRFAGSERYALELAAAQAAAHDVTLILCKAAARDSAQAIAHRVDPSVKIRLVENWLQGWHARRVIRQLRPDIAHAHLSRACKSLASLAGVCVCVGTLHICYKQSQHRTLDGLIAIAPWQLNAIPQRLKNRAVQIDNWTLPVAASPGARERLRSELGIEPDDFLFGSVGRIEKSKGMDVLIAAHRQLNIPSCKLVIVGEGSRRNKLQKRLGPGAHLVGFSNETHNWLAAFDGFVSPSRSEPFGLAMLEAMQAGLPTIATRSEGAKHLMHWIETDLVPLGDAAALSQSMRQLQTAGQFRKQYSLQSFNYEAQCKLIENFYLATQRRLRLRLRHKK